MTLNNTSIRLAEHGLAVKTIFLEMVEKMALDSTSQGVLGNFALFTAKSDCNTIQTAEASIMLPRTPMMTNAWHSRA
jgi:hypothetical protein